MKLSVRALAISIGLFWGLAVFIVSLFNLMQPSYGAAFLEIISSVYPGYHHTGGLGSVLVVALYAAVDGAIGGLLFAWLYNVFAGRQVSKN